jgi:hypothetical protein
MAQRRDRRAGKMSQVRVVALWVFMVLSFTASVLAEDLGQLDLFGSDSTANPFSVVGNPFSETSPNNAFGTYGNPFSNQSATNPFATDAPRHYDRQGNYRGKLTANPYDPDSNSNAYRRYGNPYSRDSFNNPYGAGNLFLPNSPNNPYGSG